MLRYPGFPDEVRLALNEREQVIDTFVGDVVALGVYELVRYVSYLVSYRRNALAVNLYVIRRIGYACKGHHTSALTVDSRFDSRLSDVDRFHEVGLRRYVRRAALENVQFDRADLAADLFLDPELELLAGPGEIAVTEDVDGSALGALADVASVRETDSLRNGDDDVRVDFQRRADVREELIVIERSLRQ